MVSGGKVRPFFDSSIHNDQTLWTLSLYSTVTEHPPLPSLIILNALKLLFKHIISSPLTHSTSLCCQRCKHVNSCDIVMRWESLPSAPITAPVSSSRPRMAAFASHNELSAPITASFIQTLFPVFFPLVYLFSFSPLLPTQWNWYPWVLNTAKICVVSKNRKYFLTLSLRWGLRLKRQTGGDCGSEMVTLSIKHALWLLWCFFLYT